MQCVDRNTATLLGTVEPSTISSLPTAVPVVDVVVASSSPRPALPLMHSMVTHGTPRALLACSSDLLHHLHSCMRDVSGQWDHRHDEHMSLCMFLNDEMHEYGCVREFSEALSPPCCRAWLLEDCITRPFPVLFNCRTFAATLHPLAMFVRMKRVPARSRCEVCSDIDTDILGVTMISRTLSIAFLLFNMNVGTCRGRLLCAWAVVPPIQMPLSKESAMSWTVDGLNV